MDKEISLISENKRLERIDDDEELPTDAFQLINKMIFDWFKQVYLEEDDVCDELTSYLHKWSVDESSRLYDPALRNLLQKIIKKVFNHLIIQLNSLGAKVIFADTSRIIIDTGKPTKNTAENFVSFVLKSIISFP